MLQQRRLREKCLAWKLKCFPELQKGKDQESEAQMSMLTTFRRMTPWFRNG